MHTAFIYIYPSIRSLANSWVIMRNHVIVKLPTHRDGGSWSGILARLSNNTAAAEKLVAAFCCRPPMPLLLYIVYTS